jgi:hypothetical protein
VDLPQGFCDETHTFLEARHPEMIVPTGQIGRVVIAVINAPAFLIAIEFNSRLPEQ